MGRHTEMLDMQLPTAVSRPTCAAPAWQCKRGEAGLYSVGHCQIGGLLTTSPGLLSLVTSWLTAAQAQCRCQAAHP